MADRLVRRRRRARTVLLALLVIASPFLGFAADSAAHRGRIWRGVMVGGEVDLSGLAESAARQKLADAATRARSRSLRVVVGDKSATVTLAELGCQLAIGDTLARAMAARREPGVRRLWSWIESFRRAREVAVDERCDPAKLSAALDRWERELVDAPFEGAILVKDGAVVAEAPRTGHAIDRDAATAAIRAAVARASETSVQQLALTLAPKTPARDERAVQSAFERAQLLTAAPITLSIERAELDPDEGQRPATHRPAPDRKKKPRAQPQAERVSVAFSREQLFGALSSRLVEPAAIEVAFDPQALDAALGKVRKEVEAPPVDAHFEFDAHDKPHAVPGRPGRALKAADVASALALAAAAPDRSGKLPVVRGAEPEHSVADLDALGIKGPVSQFTTKYPCCMPRVDNIHRIADLLDGAIVKPGELLSVNERIGPRTAEKGFKPAPTIVYGEIEDTIGGGISQFATTLFNAAFYGGYDIVERTPHSYYFPRYPMGHEATLSFPKPDLVIRNDTNAGLLVRCLYTKTSITVKLYGDNGGRRVRRKVSRARNVTRPPIEYIADPSLDPDRRKVKERGQIGWTVVVSRIIDFPDGTSRTEERKVVYQPRVRRVRVHPCRIPEGDKGYTGEPCPAKSEDERNGGKDEAEPNHDGTESPPVLPKEGHDDGSPDDEG